MSFDLLAPHYRWLEVVLAQNKLQRCRAMFLDRVAGARRVLIAGEGNGRFLLECRRQLPTARITCLDASARMLDSARRRLRRNSIPLEGIDFVCANALSWNAPEHTFDVLVTHFFLDCFLPAQLARLTKELARAASESAKWLLADFQVPPAGLARCRAHLLHWAMYAFFRAVTRLPARELTAPDPFLEANGFHLGQRRVSEWGLLHSDIWLRG